MENSDYQYSIHPKQQQENLDENWELEEGPTTPQLETESETVYCNVCRRKFRSKKALWGHRRCCKAARSAGNRNEGTGVSDFKHAVLESGWSVTAKRGRKPVLEITGPESMAAGILIYMSSAKCNDVVLTQGREKPKAEMNESPPFGNSPMAQITSVSEFFCVICGKAFSSYQALGGHKASHGKDHDLMVNSVKGAKELKHSKGLTSSDHQCEVCGISYPSGQALGGHKRKHWTGSSFMPGNSSKASKFPASVATCIHWESFWTDN